MSTKAWHKLMCDTTRLQLKGTLNGGQSFRWKKQEISEENEKEQWVGIFGGCIWWLIQEQDHLLYKVVDPTLKNDEPAAKKTKLNDADCNKKYDQLLHDYFRLDVDLDEYYKKWSKADQYFDLAAKEFYGIRMLAQDPMENIFSFICSSNNNIARITGMIEKMCTLYGNKICEVDGITYHSFPDVESLAQPDVEDALREAGFGYRAKYVSQSAVKIIGMGGTNWIANLKTMTYADAKQSLMRLTGIGAKVADCICLMSLGHLEAIPVDTHIYQIAAKYYLTHLPRRKSVTDKIYTEIGDYFRQLYGPYAGWAHTILFCADLKVFKKDDVKEVKTSRKKK